MIRRFGVVLALALAVAAIAVGCTREDGLPDPPVQQLVPCDPAAASGSPLACPPTVDAGATD
ncbi:MAG TPA: hypothetical protein VGL86_20590 [Polyangia bacterium]|jgi:hypothetical protein